jgi:hypothetical protein
MDSFFGGSAPSAKFSKIGDEIEGEIVDVLAQQQQRSFKPDGLGDLLYWDDGKPRMQLPVCIQTEQRDPAIEDDDGVRTVYLKKALKKAVGEAMKKVGHRGDPVIGDWLKIQFYAEEENGTPNPTKQYRAKYTKAVKSADVWDDEPVKSAASAGKTQKAADDDAPW